MHNRTYTILLKFKIQNISLKIGKYFLRTEKVLKIRCTSQNMKKIIILTDALLRIIPGKHGVSWLLIPESWRLVSKVATRGSQPVDNR